MKSVSKQTKLKNRYSIVMDYLLRIILPRQAYGVFHIMRIILKEYGYWNSIKNKCITDKDGRYIPWFTYPAYEFINSLDLKNKTVFEWGSGHSTVYWSKKCKSVTSVEDNKEWYEKISRFLNRCKNVNLIFSKDKEEYLDSIKAANFSYDLIIIDGSYRIECLKKAVGLINDGGFIIFDNSDWYEKPINEIIRNAWLKIDFNGFSPTNEYTSRTSILFSIKSSLKQKNRYQTIGGIKANLN